MQDSGLTIAAYRVVKSLAENQVYRTYLVDHPEHGECRLLLIDSELLFSMKERHDFLEQGKVLRGKTLLGICSLLEAHASEEHRYCLYPEPVGVPLAELLDDGFAPEEALRLVKQIATALSLMHSSGLWHGHLSPATIYIDQGRISLADFGLASLVKIDFNSAIDPRYASPELVCGEELGPPADLYSLGVLLYRLLTGDVPFEEREPLATAMLHVQAEVAPLPKEFAQYQPLIDGLLKSLPDERFSAQELILGIERLLTTGSAAAGERPVDPDDGSEPDKNGMVANDSSPINRSEIPPESLSESLPQEEKLSAFERLSASPASQSGAKQRLQARAAALQESGTLAKDASRANSQRMASISRQNFEKKQSMIKQQQPAKAAKSLKRYYWLAVLGAAAGVISYGVALDRQTPIPAQVEVGVPIELQSALEKGILQLQIGELKSAEQTFLGLVKDYSIYPQPYNNLASVYAAQGDLEQARNYLEKALATDESYATVYQNLGTVYSEMARDSYGRALQLEKGKQAVRLQLFPGEHEIALASSGPLPKESQQGAASATEQTQTAQLLAKTEPAKEATVVEPPAAVEPPKRVPGGLATEPAVDGGNSPQAASTAPPRQAPAAPEPNVAEMEAEVGLETGETVLKRWATSWSSQAVDDYLAFYAAEFTPANGSSRQAWEDQRRRRLTRPKNISLKLRDFVLLESSKNRIKLELTQQYQSDRYADKTRKMFDLIKQNGAWQILRERSLGRVR